MPAPARPIHDSPITNPQPPVPNPEPPAPVADPAAAAPDPAAIDPAIRDSILVDAGGGTPPALELVTTVDPATLRFHPYADLLPLMSPAEFADLKKAIALDGQQEPGRMYQGLLLDGRNRCHACRDLGLPFLVQPFVGTDQQALTYVLSTNQHRRNLTKTHRAVVGVEILAHLAPEVNARRIEKLKATLQRKRTGECSAILQNTPELPGTKVSVARLAADIMGVSERYVADALRVKLTDQAIFEQMKTGKLSLQAALRLIEGTPDAEFARQSREARRRVAAILRRAKTKPELLDRFLDALDGFEQTMAEPAASS